MNVYQRHGNTEREMVESGEWVKVARQHYRYINGSEITYDRNAWGWRIDGGNQLFNTLWVAKCEVEKACHRN